MKLVLLVLIAINIKIYAAQEHFTFQPHFQNQNPGIFSSESSVYLPPESHTPMPYLSVKDFNKLPFAYLPPSNNKGHAMFPTSFPFMISSSLVPSDDNDDDDDRIITNHREQNKSVQRPQITKNVNRTERTMPAQPIKREMKPIPNNFKFSQQIDRNDMKPFPFAANNLPNTMKNTLSQTASPRSFIISPDNNKIDQTKSGSFLTPQYLTTPGLFVSTTVEPAIPIIRLSNEMDLDGSFSYEALGADQTHYVQHSHMENFGTDKQEQVVEGSYSYIGDNGQTYTVHYVADSNGFRATGDHLPVAPPIPEIIQRAIQYNLAEEARNPPAYKNSWEYGNNENEISESEKVHRFAFSPPQNLFTGKTPESFSHSFSQANDKQNNLLTASSTNTVKTVEFRQDQLKHKRNDETISPQVTFVASQGAHVPNKAQQQTQQSIARMFSTEKPTMSQLMNYEAAIKNAEQENNKALWRWQYGINAENNPSSNKNTISRSSGDDVIINFNDMTPEQYSNMIKTEIHHEYNEQQNNVNDKISTDEGQETKQTQYTTLSSITQSQSDNSDILSSNLDFKHNTEAPHNVLKSNNPQIKSDARAKLITLSEFLPPSRTVTQSYDYIDNYEARKVKPFQESIDSLNVIPLSKTNDNHLGTSYTSQNTYQNSFVSSTPTGSKFDDFIIKDDDQSFKPVSFSTTEEPTTELKLEDSLKQNFFLKNVLNEKPKSNQNGEISAKSDKSVKYFAVQARPFEERKEPNKKPIDMADVLRFMSSKSNFESSKIRPRMKSEYNDGQKNERFIQDYNTKDMPKDEKSYNKWNQQQHEELKGLIKNYKVLQRNYNQGLSEERVDHLRRISPPTLGNMQSPKLPPLGRAGPSMKSYLPPIYV